MSSAPLRATFLALSMLVTGVAACNGCRAPRFGQSAAQDAPTLRLYVLSDVAGALEPCGCTKDQLGGVDHLSGFIGREKGKAPAAGLVAAGPLFFMDPVPEKDHLDQDLAKADTMAQAFKSMGLLAFAPGENDWAGGKERLAKLSEESGAPALGEGAGPSWVIRTVGGVKIALIGVAQPPASSGPSTVPPAGQVRGAFDAAKAEGADVFVALAAVGRGEAKRIADAVPELTAIIVGSRKSAGDTNTDTPPTERVGDVLILQTANHVQSALQLDLYVRDGAFRFADGVGLERDQKRRDLSRRIEEMHVRIANWERDAKVSKKDIEDRKRDLVKLEADRAALDIAPAPSTGSFFRVAVTPVRASLGADPATTEAFRAFHKGVNEKNRVAFAERTPVPVPEGGASFIGVEACSACHAPARAVWDKTKHAHAYASLSSEFRQFDLDCVSCHVTGYEKPGGSTVTHVEKLENMQCENCHGPGSKHAGAPMEKGLIVAKPGPEVCVTCHHPPHVEGFNAKEKMVEILGVGHGKR